jgi:hypothetical protein
MTVEEALLREYEKTVDLFIGEDRIAWELVSIYMAVQIGLASAVVVIYTKELGNLSVIGFRIFCLAGFVSSLAWFFIQYRSKMWRENWLLTGLKIERELKDRGIRLDLFETEYRIRKKIVALELFDDKIRYRQQYLHERIGALRVAHYSMFVLGIIWLVALFFSITVNAIP